MIEQLSIKNFKGHAETILPFGKITMLSGMNAMGKSSVIQTILLLRQTHARGLLTKGLELNGDLCSIGVAGDAMYKYSLNSDDIELAMKVDEHEHTWSFRVDASNVASTFIKANNTTIKEPNGLNIFNHNFQYISAYRNGPVESYDKDTSSVELLNQISRKEGRCELVAHYFDYYKDYIVHADVLKKGTTDNSVKYQVEEWMREISPNINIEVNQRDTDFGISYSFGRGKGNTKTENLRATNIGFGVSYVLPIVLATIVANAKKPVEDSVYEPGKKIIVIENPEAHIHPNAQASLMELICLAAKNGVQFLIETHSDHIINSLLVAIKQNVLSNEEACVYYFDRDESTHSTISYALSIQPGGKIRNPPKGFFDQIDIHMKQLIGF